MVPREVTELMAARVIATEETARVAKPEKTPAVALARRTVPETGAWPARRGRIESRSFTR